MKALLLSLLFVATASVCVSLAGQQTGEPGAPSLVPLTRTDHAGLPQVLSQYWLVPDTLAGRAPRRPRGAAVSGLARGAAAIAEGKFAVGLGLVSGQGLDESPLADYASYYRALALQGLSRLDEADAVLTALGRQDPPGALGEAVQLKLADVVVARHDSARAKELLRALIASRIGAPDEMLSRLGQVEEELAHTDHAADAYRKIYVSYPGSPRASDAKTGLERLSIAITPAESLERAERLFSSRRWSDARAGFQSVLATATGTDRQHALVRLGQCDERLGRHRAARDQLLAALSGAPRDAEVRYFYLTAVRGTGDRGAYAVLVHALVADTPESPWAIEALNDLASDYIVGDDDEAADAVFRELLQRYPGHRYAERAAWKVGWLSYRRGGFAQTISLFESAAQRFPRSDYRPAWLYWSGRARDRLNDGSGAASRYALAVADYGGSYYGRLAARLLVSRPSQIPAARGLAGLSRPAAEVPTASTIQYLMSAGMLDDALREVQYAQRVWGDRPDLQATSAWLRYQQAQTLRGDGRFDALRGAITTMRRAYPQFLSAAGGALPPEVLRIIFPLDYWDLIEKYSAANGLDPYLISALVAQESTFTAEIRSSANARGLMQVMPATGRRYARKLGIRPFTTASLSQAETNMRIGVRYFKDLVDRFGSVHYALASYNAGDSRVAAWIKAEPDLPPDEFIDSIPFPETQNYVKRILGTTEDYRRLYGTGLLAPNARPAAAATN